MGLDVLLKPKGFGGIAWLLCIASEALGVLWSERLVVFILRDRRIRESGLINDALKTGSNAHSVRGNGIYFGRVHRSVACPKSSK